MALDSKVPKGPIKDKWTDYKNHINLVNPANLHVVRTLLLHKGVLMLRKIIKVMVIQHTDCSTIP